MTLPEVLVAVEPWGPQGPWSNLVSWDECPPPTANVIVNREARGYVMRRWVPTPADPEHPQRLEEERVFPSRDEFLSHLRDPPLPSCRDVYISMESWGIMVDLRPDGRLESADAATFVE
jgi:hypothetical protein